MSKKIKMLKPGTFTAMNGKTVSFSEADLRATAAAYDPSIYAAPFVLGHPKHDSPSYGKLGSADFSEGFLNGEGTQVDPAFAEAVNAGKFDKVSLSLYEPDSPNNPVPGVYYPRHLGFLGAMPPAVKGLGTVSFGDAETGIVEFGGYEDRVVVRMFRNMKNFLIEQFGQDQADKVIDEYDLTYLTEDALAPEQKPAEALDYHEKGDDNMNLTAVQLAEKETSLNQREAALKLQETTKIHSDNLSFAEALVAQGKLLPANKPAVVAVLDFASGVTEGGTIEFGEGDAKKSEAPLETLKTLFSGMPKVIEFGEVFSAEEPGQKKTAIPADISKYV